jgi:molybdenum cofactor guanylyltransferase
VSAVVLAGGRSSRFGSDKLAADLGGSPLLHHAVVRLGEITSDVVVVLAPEADEPAMPPTASVRFVRDDVESGGPLAGAVAGLGVLERALAVVVGGAMPEMSRDVVMQMIRVASERSVDAVVLHDGDEVSPLPVVVRVTRAHEIGRAALHEGRRSLREWLAAMHPVVLDRATWAAFDPSGATLRDVDVPADLDAGSFRGEA